MKLFYVKIEDFTKFQKINVIDNMLDVKNPFYDLSQECCERKKPTGGMWAYSIYEFKQIALDINGGDWVVLYPISHVKEYSDCNLKRKYKRKNSCEYIRKINSNLFDLDYEQLANNYDMIKIDETLNNGYDTFIMNLSAFRVYRTCKFSDNNVSRNMKTYQDKFRHEINTLDITDNLKYYLTRAYGFHVCGNFLCVDDIVYDIIHNDGIYIKEKTPNLGKVKYDVLKEALVKAGYLSEEYLSPKKEKPQKIMVEVNSNNKELLIQFLQDNQFVYKEK